MTEQHGNILTAVYVQTNDATNNEVLAFKRRADGELAPLGRFATGGRGTGKPHLPSQSSIVLSDDGRQLLAVNAGSDELSLFAVQNDGLRLCDRVAILREGKVVADENLDAMRARAPREVTFRWKDESASSEAVAPGFLDVRERRGPMWRCRLTGPVMDLVRWSAAQPLDDLTIGRPDLEGLFREFYQRRADA